MSHQVLFSGPLTHQSHVTPGWLVAETGPTSADTDGFNRKDHLIVAQTSGTTRGEDEKYDEVG